MAPDSPQIGRVIFSKITIIFTVMVLLGISIWIAGNKIYSAESFREAAEYAVNNNDFSRAELLLSLGAKTDEWRLNDSGGTPFYFRS